MAPLALAIGAVVLMGSWSVAAVLMCTRGFDITDEGYYILAYRDWDTNLRTFTGSQYIYGPVFDLVGQSVPGLRLVRLASVLAAHGAFAWGFVTWLAVQPDGTQLSRSWRWAAGLAVIASGGVVYGWLPLSPGYNDVSVLGSLVLMAYVLRVARGCQLDQRVPILPFALMGPVMVAILLAKSVAGLPSVLFVLVVTAAVCLQASARRGLGVGVVVLAGSVGVSLVAVNLLVMPFSRMLPPMRTVNSLVVAGTNSPIRLLEMYVSSSRQLVVGTLVVLVVPLVVVLVACLALRLQMRGVALTLLALAAPSGLLLLNPRRVGLPPAGPSAVLGYAAALAAMALFVIVVLSTDAKRRRRRQPAGAQARGRARIVVAAIAVLPAVQALGTGNALYVMAVNAIACWVALMVMAVVAVRERPTLFVPVLSATVVAVVLAGGTGVDGLLVHPYRADSYQAATQAIGGTGVLAGLRVAPQRAEGFDRLLGTASPSGAHSRVVLAFDEMPGLVLLLDARTPGEAWYSATDLARTAAGIRSSCAMLQDPRNESPVALFNRVPAASDRAALRACGIVLTADPTTVRLVGQRDLLVFSTVRS